MKKLLTIALVALIAVSAFAQGASEASKGQVTLEWWTWDATMADTNNAIIAAYEATHPNVKINNTIIPTDGGAYATQLAIMAQQKNLPDVFTISSGNLEDWAEIGYLRNLDELIAKDKTIFDQFYKGMFDAVKDVAKTDYYCAIPFAYVSCDLFYNKDMFDAAGLAYPNENWTWDDFVKAAKALTIDKNGDGEIDQWGYYGYGRYAEAQAWVIANNGTLINNKMRFEPDKNALEALHFFTDLVLKDKVAPMPKDMTAMKYNNIFPNALCAMFVDGGWQVNDFRSKIGDKFRWGVTRVPNGPSAKETWTFGWPDSYVLSPTTAHPDEAWDFVKFAAGGGLSADQVMGGKLSAYKAIVESPEFVDMTQQPYGDMELFREHANDKFMTTYTKSWSEWTGYGAAENMGFAGAVDSILNGEDSFDGAMKKATDGINKILSRVYP
ncbi:MAG: sugar ABC transporter substrate-binding protein [Spirochaetales bacterium]|nr:sugar ABC transporter substrate-binding protein [Spirochaetales bacterium]